MLILMIGLVVFALLGNIGYYEYWYRRPVKKDIDIMNPWFILQRIKNGKRV